MGGVDTSDERLRVPKVLYLLSHPIQYQVPLLRYLATSGRIDVHTLFTKSAGSTSYFDVDFGEQVVWDLDLTAGYSHEFLDGWGQERPSSRTAPWVRGLGAALRRTAPDAVWVHGYDTANAVRLILRAKGRRLPVLVRADVEELDSHGGATARVVKDRVLRQAYRAFDGFLTIGERNAQFYRDRGVPEDRLFPMPYAVDNEAFAQAAVRAEALSSLQEEHGLPPHLPVFVFSGKLIPRKRPLDAIRALAMLRDRHGVDACLVVVGSGELGGACCDEVQAASLGDRVRMAGFLNQEAVRLTYARSTALLITSQRERWGLVSNEAMASCCPVITYRSVGSADDLVQNGISGLVVPTADVGALALAMAQLCDPRRRELLVQGAAQRIRDFSFAADEAGLLEALDKLALVNR